MTGDERFDALLRSYGQGMEKHAVGLKDWALEGARGLSRSVLGSHGLAGWSPLVKHPLRSVWKGITNMPWWGVPLQIPQAMNIYHDVTDPNKGMFERAGSVAGTILPFGLGGLGHKGPGQIGSMVGQELLAGRGMLVREGLLSKGGRKLDELLHLGKKPLQVPKVQAAPPRLTPDRVLNTMNTVGTAVGYFPPDFDWRKDQ